MDWEHPQRQEQLGLAPWRNTAPSHPPLATAYHRQSHFSQPISASKPASIPNQGSRGTGSIPPRWDARPV